MNVTRTIATAAATMIAFTGLIAMTAGPAAADTPTCVSKTEYRNAKLGMRKTRVHTIFDVAGRQTSSFNIGGTFYESREYKPCSSPRWGFVWMDYENGRVESKFAYWG